ncbi:hypothetical protein Tco_0590987 [Tanacetum coccineum]
MPSKKLEVLIFNVANVVKYAAFTWDFDSETEHVISSTEVGTSSAAWIFGGFPWVYVIKIKNEVAEVCLDFPTHLAPSFSLRAPVVSLIFLKSARRDVVRQQNVEKSSYAKELDATATFELKGLPEEVTKLMNHSETQFILLELKENGHT